MPNLETVFPSAIDNTMREAFFACPTKWWRSFAQNLAPIQPSVHLHAGAAFASGLEVTRKTYYANGRASPEEALYAGTKALVAAYGNFIPPETGSGAVKTCSRMVEALEAYFDRFPLTTETLVPDLTINGPTVEFTFSIPLPGYTNPDTGDPILYAGRFDMLAKRGGSYYIVDEKTTTSLGVTWASQWDLASQLSGYCWAARQYGFPVVGAVIRGVGLLKTETKFIEVPVFRPEFQIDRWYEQLQRDISRMIAQYIEFKQDSVPFDMALGHSCSNYGGCPFRILCQSNEPDNWIDGRYTVRTWDPLHKGGEE